MLIWQRLLRAEDCFICWSMFPVEDRKLLKDSGEVSLTPVQ